MGSAGDARGRGRTHDGVMRILSSPKRILITGASRGIGRCAAIALARRGHTVVLAARDAAALDTLAEQLRGEGHRAEALPMDVTDDARVSSAIATMLRSGPCDVVVNNAGSCDQALFLAQDAAIRRAEMELNFFGAQRVTAAVLPSMIRRRAGVIVNVSSLVGVIASPTTANYSATKAALNAWSHALRGEVARDGVRVVVFVAPHTDTDMGRAAHWDGVPSLPVEYTAEGLIRAIDRTPRIWAASPVYRLFIRLAGFLPAFMERRVAASTERVPANLLLAK